MKSNYKQLREYIRPVDVRNKKLEVDLLLGVSVQKVFIPSIANTVGTDFKKYKIVKRKQFTYIPDTSRRGDKIGLAMLEDHDIALVSQAYSVFDIIDHDKLDPEYLMMWFRRPEFDRYARYKSHGSVREIFDWEEMCEVELPIPSIEKQREIVKEYNTVVNRIKLNEQLNQKLEETAQALFKNWFVDGTNEDLMDLDSYIEFNPKHLIKKNTVVSYIEMADVQESAMSIKKNIKREFTSGSKFKNEDTLLARITPCLENGKTAFVDCLVDNEVAYGSTEFIVMRAKKAISPYWVYCLAKDDMFRTYAISSMVGSSGRQRVHSDYLKEYKIASFTHEKMQSFHTKAKPIFEQIKVRASETKLLVDMKGLLLSKMTKVEAEENTYTTTTIAD
ncbi:restriction endonuclease subunit S [Ancylomarina salipaludis]|uniref:Restriction endonuclease subunit S n=1 Tax=Ancylomarina salipaludis TaxID=2501299 RepID=A0A4V1MZU2_9BACT|nr:restriction endonuclease subunit S [Ancylomarina salipaludis]RXQ89491.1 restriction endonuclease subunit S [Ancylomarina salipaludis]